MNEDTVIMVPLTVGQCVLCKSAVDMYIDIIHYSPIREECRKLIIDFDKAINDAEKGMA